MVIYAVSIGVHVSVLAQNCSHTGYHINKRKMLQENVLCDQAE